MSAKPCCVEWCACLAVADGEYCAVHRTNKDIHPVRPDEAPDKPLASSTCPECNGTGECQDCDGEGVHQCEHYRCHDEHDCGACEGTGDCPECEGKSSRSDKDKKSPETRYLEWVADVAWQPWQRPNPWDEAAA